MASADLLLLTYAVCSGLSLEVDLRVPVCVVHDDRVSRLEIQTHTPSSGAQQKDTQAAGWITESAYLRQPKPVSLHGKSQSPHLVGPWWDLQDQHELHQAEWASWRILSFGLPSPCCGACTLWWCSWPERPQLTRSLLQACSAGSRIGEG